MPLWTFDEGSVIKVDPVSEKLTLHPTNHYYGHAEILSRHAGLPSTPPIIGKLQHGWQMGSGFDEFGPVTRRIPKFAWSARNLTNAREAGFTRVTAIGAPFLYLLAESTVSDGTGTIAYPFHGTIGLDPERDDTRYVTEVLESEGPAVTFCLYYYDYEDPEIRAVYEETGARVITHGHRTDPEFLNRHLAELLRHERVVTNRVATVVWYAAACGRSVEVYGPDFGFDSQADQEFLARQREMWPMLYDGGLSGTEARELGAHELGAEFVREPGELRDLLGWTGTKALIGRAIRRLDPIRNRLKSTPRVGRPVGETSAHNDPPL